MKPTLRKFTNEDTPLLLRLFYETVHTINAKDYSPELLKAWAPEMPDLKKWQTRFKAAKTVVAELDGKIVGFGNVEQGAIGMLYVDKDHQRQHVASTLLEKIEKRLMKKGVRTAVAEVSITAKPFFEKKGYAVVRENRKMLNGQTFMNYIMERALPLKMDKPMKEKQKRPDGFRWRDLFVNKLFDLMIVIAGVSIAFQLNNLKLDNDQVKLEQFYYKSLMTDLDKDIEDISRIVKDMERDEWLAKFYISNINNEQMMLDSAGTVYVNLVALETFSGNQSTYRTLVSGSGLSNLGDEDIRRQITDYYTLYPYIERFEDVHTELIFKFLYYLSPSFDLAARKVTNPTVIQNVETKNFVSVFSINLSSGKEDYLNLIEKAKALKTAISAKAK